MDDKRSESKPLKYFLDNKNFEKAQHKKKTKPQNKLEIVNDKIVLNTESADLYEEDDHVTSYTYMKNKGQRKKWTRNERELFYKSLQCCGCDFSMMNLIFPDRSRNNLKQKYIKELKLNKSLIEENLSKFEKFDADKFNMLKDEACQISKIEKK